MHIGVLQLSYSDDESPTQRRERVVNTLTQAPPADLWVLPELWGATPFNTDLWSDAGEPADGPTAQRMSTVAAAKGCYLHAGSILECGVGGATDHANTSLLFSPAGELLARYRKIHRFGFDGGEATLVEAGRDVVVAPVTVGGVTVNVGLATCYDLRFPELFRLLTDAGAELVCVVAGWPKQRIEHWDVLLRARAIENQVMVVGVNTAGRHGGQTMGGRSAISDPRGKVLWQAGEDEVVHVHDAPLETIRQARQAFPVLADRRFRTDPELTP